MIGYIHLERFMTKMENIFAMIIANRWANGLFTLMIGFIILIPAVLLFGGISLFVSVMLGMDNGVPIGSFLQR